MLIMSGAKMSYVGMAGIRMRIVVSESRNMRSVLVGPVSNGRTVSIHPPLMQTGGTEGGGGGATAPTGRGGRGGAEGGACANSWHWLVLEASARNPAPKAFVAACAAGLPRFSTHVSLTSVMTSAS